MPIPKLPFNPNAPPLVTFKVKAEAQRVMIAEAAKTARKVSHTEQLEREKQAKVRQKKEKCQEVIKAEVMVPMVERIESRALPQYTATKPANEDMGARIASRREAILTAKLAGAVCALQEMADPQETKGSVTITYKTENRSEVCHKCFGKGEIRGEDCPKCEGQGDITFPGETQNVLCSSGESARMTAEAMLMSGNVLAVQCERGVFLILLNGSQAVSREWCAKEETAQARADKAIADGKADGYRIANFITRGQYATEGKGVKYESGRRKVGPVCQRKDYDRGVRWQKVSESRNVRSNLGPQGYGNGWSQ